MTGALPQRYYNSSGYIIRGRNEVATEDFFYCKIVTPALSRRCPFSVLDGRRAPSGSECNSTALLSPFKTDNGHEIEVRHQAIPCEDNLQTRVVNQLSLCAFPLVLHSFGLSNKESREDTTNVKVFKLFVWRGEHLAGLEDYPLNNLKFLIDVDNSEVLYLHAQDVTASVYLMRGHPVADAFKRRIFKRSFSHE
ncbi:hypothetical protein C8J55DRAFT_552767 [Lentinula edodes]|uniref:Uncharacterized protein n=1 Tax=Lentinula lateritia TaxID=40482 RepID=A0A9W8ZTN1_9AGAR|nr:hypothetical protein C8J55DRAFT_552767 [Lentinula edodes]